MIRQSLRLGLPFNFSLPQGVVSSAPYALEVQNEGRGASMGGLSVHALGLPAGACVAVGTAAGAPRDHAELLKN